MKSVSKAELTHSYTASNSTLSSIFFFFQLLWRVVDCDILYEEERNQKSKHEKQSHFQCRGSSVFSSFLNPIQGCHFYSHQLEKPKQFPWTKPTLSPSSSFFIPSLSIQPNSCFFYCFIYYLNVWMNKRNRRVKGLSLNQNTWFLLKVLVLFMGIAPLLCSLFMATFILLGMYIASKLFHKNIAKTTLVICSQQKAIFWGHL